MARAIRWQIQFKSLNGTLYTVNIYQDGWTGTITQLTGSANPFFIDENSDTDAFLSIRESTGYISFIANDQDTIDALYANNILDHYVELTNGSNAVVWAGYIQPEMYVNSWSAFPIEVQLPVVSKLGALEYIEFTPTHTLRTLGNILHECLTAVGGYTDIYLGDGYNGAWSSHDFIILAVSDDAFGEIEDVELSVFPEGVTPFHRQSEYATMKEWVENIMLLYALTIREVGNTLFIEHCGISVWSHINFSDLLSGTDYTCGSSQVYSSSLPAVKGNSGERTLLQGYDKICFTDELKEQPETFDAATSNQDVEMTYNNGVMLLASDSSQLVGRNQDGVRIYSLPNISETYHSSKLAAHQYNEDGEEVTANLASEMIDGTQVQSKNYGAQWVGFNLNTVDSDDFEEGILFRHGGQDKIVAEIRSLREYSGAEFDTGLQISAKSVSRFCHAAVYHNSRVGTMSKDTEVCTGDNIHYMMIQWGSMYLNSSYEWQSSQCYIPYKLLSDDSSNSQKGVGHFLFYRTGSSLKAYIPANRDLHGYITIRFKDLSTSISHQEDDGTTYNFNYTFLYDIKVTPRSLSDYSFGNVNLKRNCWWYKNSLTIPTEKAYCKDISIATRCSKRQKAANFLFNVSGSIPLVCSDTTRRSTLYMNVARYYGRSIEEIKTTIDYADNFAANQHLKYNGWTYRIISRSINFRDGKQQLRLQRLRIMKQT